MSIMISWFKIGLIIATAVYSSNLPPEEDWRGEVGTISLNAEDYGSRSIMISGKYTPMIF